MTTRFILLLLLTFPFLCAAQIDTTIGCKAPASVCGDYKELSHYLCGSLRDERAKANAIYNWITHNIAYDIDAVNSVDVREPDEITERTLRRKKAVCEGYSMLFSAMCREAGMKSVDVTGYAKTMITDNGDSVYMPRHMWVATEINGEWQLSDPTWGAGGVVSYPGRVRAFIGKVFHVKSAYIKKFKFKYAYDTAYFAQDPETFRLKHLPSDPLWQLTDTVMPLQVFEAGDSAIIKFNQQYSKPHQRNTGLEYISALSDGECTAEMADRAYEYNHRFPAVLAIKSTYQAANAIKKTLSDSTAYDPYLLVNNAQQTLGKSEGYFREQKKYIPAQYTRLKQKNKTKSQIGMKDIREIKTDEKRMLASAKKYEHAASTKMDKAHEKHNETRKRRKGLSPDHIQSIESSKISKKPDAPEMKQLTDSIASRNTRMATLQSRADSLRDAIKARELSNASRLDTLAKAIMNGDSMLVQQAICRFSMHDSYDDDVILWQHLYKETRYHHTDTLQKYYLTNYDTVLTLHDQWLKAQIPLLDIYKKNLKNLEQYRKWNAADEEVTGAYPNMVNDYKYKLNMYDTAVESYIAYIKANRQLFANIRKASHKKDKIIKYMEHAETARKNWEAKKLAHDQDFDNRENERQMTALKNLKEQLKQMTEPG